MTRLHSSYRINLKLLLISRNTISFEMMLEMIWMIWLAVAPRELAKLGIKVKALEDIEAWPRLSSNRAQQHNYSPETACG